MTVRQHWICAGIALAALYVGLFAGRLGGKHAADRWYAEHQQIECLQSPNPLIIPSGNCINEEGSSYKFIPCPKELK